MSARFPVALSALLMLAVFSGAFAVVGTAAPSATGGADAQFDDLQVEQPSAGNTTIALQLRPNGDARWTVATRFEMANEEDREAFRELARRFENGQLKMPWLGMIRAANRAAANATGRPMNVTEVEKTTDADNGTVRLHLTWTNFARSEGDHYVVDDAFNTTSGTWLDGLTESQSLVVLLPRNHGVLDAPPGATVSLDENARVSWEGPQVFEPGYLQVVYSGDGGRTASTTTSTPKEGTFDGLLWGGFVVIGLGIVAVGAYVISRRGGGLPGPTMGDGPDAPAGTVGSPSPTTDGDASSAPAGAVDANSDEPEEDVDEELLSDEERVERLLDRNGGRMKQANIVRETGWSNAKVSQLLSAMEAEGQINKLRIGRENLISFPGEDVADVDND